MAQHKWHKEIKAWADGAEIETRYVGVDPYCIDEFKEWGKITLRPIWNDDYWEFRIKPTPKEPQYLYAYYLHGIDETVWFNCEQEKNPNIQYLGKIKLEQE